MASRVVVMTRGPGRTAGEVAGRRAPAAARRASAPPRPSAPRSSGLARSLAEGDGAHEPARRRRSRPFVLIALLLAAWEVACRALAVPAYFLPPPSAIAAALAARLRRCLLRSAWNTLSMALIALAGRQPRSPRRWPCSSA